ncbi:DNA sulfur modification protein DndD [Pseudanabaena sp. lw0831]|uniref:DNA sulfur modification protein DndD n=1 Tax=Pseudanabaena sp. lw0831 TaxID=1357935 RepID=UPI0019163CEB|nr:DNA sulfur modification protein DndD [Pseudanabaena sp. lw0831]GBO55077.1 DNA sulfur modification protein DndD [Pseudanabaena sp. lw0831]
MIFRELTLQNFGAYQGKHTINLSVDVNQDHPPIVLLGGLNGGGKTTFIDALRLVLYGAKAQCSTRGNLSYGEFLSQSVNREAKIGEEAAIELVFEQASFNKSELRQVPISISRRWTQQPKNGRDILEVRVDSWNNETLTNTWDEFIEEIMPIGISGLFLFDGEQVRELALQDTPTQGIVDAIRTILGLELVDRLEIDLEVLASKKRRESSDTEAFNKLTEIETQIAQQSAEIELEEAHKTQLEADLEQAKATFAEAEREFMRKGGKAAGDKQELEQSYHRLKEESDQQRKALLDLAETCLPMMLIKSPLLEQALSQSQKEIHLQKAKAALDLIKERDRKLSEFIDQNFPKKYNRLVQEFLETELAQLEDESQHGEIWLGSDIELVKSLSNLLAHDLPKTVALASTAAQKLESCDRESTQIQNVIASAASPEIYQQLLQKKEESEAVCESLANQLDDAQRNLALLERKLISSKKELENYGTTIVARGNLEFFFQSVVKVQFTMDSFRKELTAHKIAQLENSVTECFLHLLHKSRLVHRITIAPDTFRLELYNAEGKAIPKHRLSAGEKQMLAIAFLWGLARVSGCQLPVVIDTPLGRLDSSHRLNLLDRYFPNASQQVILLSTDTEIGKEEVTRLRQNQLLAHEYLLDYDESTNRTSVRSGYFW